MPIVDVEIVCSAREAECLPSANSLADALGRVFGSAPGHTWVRVRALSETAYAENACAIASSELPVFVTVLHARAPTDAALRSEVLAVTQAVAACLQRDAARVHVAYAPDGAGRQAFGGRLV